MNTIYQKRGNILFFLVVFFLLLFSNGNSTHATVNSASQFLPATRPASQLDLILLSLEQQWRDSVFRDNDYFKTTAPLVMQTKTYVHCVYDSTLDKIIMHGFITAEDEFFKLTVFQRKELLKQCLHLGLDFLKAQTPKINSKQSFDVNDIKFELTLNSSPPRSRGLLKNWGITQGQAGYLNGKMIFSEQAYLTIKKANDLENLTSSKNTVIIIPSESSK